MSQKRRFLDVWLVDSNTVYREVPFDVVADWIQQSRLLPDDMLRPSGTAEWLKVGAAPDFTAYFPRAEPHAVGDQAEALGAVELDFSWKRPREDEDEDVDMIPLIDVSLVLLIFFIMTATGVSAKALFDTPPADNGLVSGNPKLIWIGITEKDGKVVYSIGTGDERPAADDDNLDSQAALVERLDARLATLPMNSAEVTIRADKDIEAGVVRDLTVELTRRSGPGGKIGKKYITVSEKSQR